MKYIKVIWKHSDPDYPILLYSELDDRRFEVRKVEVFPGGRFGYAGHGVSGGTTRLGIVPVPLITEIAQDAEFDPIEITRAQFEEMWRNAVSGSTP